MDIKQNKFKAIPNEIEIFETMNIVRIGRTAQLKVKFYNERLALNKASGFISV